VPIESVAELGPAPPTVSGTLAVALASDAPTDADGDALTELTCALPVEPCDVLPPPACTAPTEFVAVLLPDPPTPTGTEAVAVAPA